MGSMSNGNNKHWDQVLAAAEDQGLKVERPGERRNRDGSRKKGGSRIRVSNPATGEFVFVDGGPSDYRGINNNISLMRNKVGFVWKGRGGHNPGLLNGMRPDEEKSDQPGEPEAAFQRRQRHARSRRSR